MSDLRIERHGSFGVTLVPSQASIVFWEVELNLVCPGSELSAIAQVHVDQTNNPMGYDVEDIELQEPSLLLPTINNDATSLSPSTQDWPGMQDFSVRVPPPVKSKDAQVCGQERHRLCTYRNFKIFFTVQQQAEQAVHQPEQERAGNVQGSPVP